MPKKQRRTNLPAPSGSYVHPSLARTPPNTAESHKPDDQSVNQRIEHLRRTQITGPRISGPEDLSASRYASRPSPLRRVAGPPPPLSWLVTNRTPHAGAASAYARQRPLSLYALPGAVVPSRRTLLYQLLKSLAVNLDWHVGYDNAYLSMLPVDVKMLLFTFIAVFGLTGAIGVAALRSILCTPEENDIIGATGSQELTRLDLSGSLGHRLSFQQLERFWTKTSQRLPQEHLSRLPAVIDSWEQAVDLGALTLETPLRFPHLTHLSVSHPGPHLSWPEFVAFSRNLGSITHLSLSFWPRPQLPQATDKTLQDEAYPPADAEQKQEAAHLLQTLCRNTPSLTWLSLAGCQAWYDDLLPLNTDTLGRASRNRNRDRNSIDPWSDRDVLTRSQRSARHDRANTEPNHLLSASANTGRNINTGGSAVIGPDWTETWRRVRHVDLSQGWLPLGLSGEDLQRLVSLRLPISSRTFFKTYGSQHEGTGLEPESYRITAPTLEVKQAMQSRAARLDWYKLEMQALKVAGSVRSIRSDAGVEGCEFDHGWGRSEAIEAGYDEQLVFDAGL